MNGRNYLEADDNQRHTGTRHEPNERPGENTIADAARYPDSSQLVVGPDSAIQEAIDVMKVEMRPISADGQCTATFTLAWNPLAVLSSEYETKPPLSMVLTLTSSGRGVQALPCGQYMAACWPSSGAQTLSAIQHAIDSEFPKGERCKWRYAILSTFSEHLLNLITDDIISGTIECAIADERLIVQVSAPAFIAMEIGQQLCWLGSACRASSAEDRHCYVRPNISVARNDDTQGPGFEIAFTETAPGSTTSEGSWTRFFRNPAVAHTFPISRRPHGEKVLEMSLEMLHVFGQIYSSTDLQGHIMLRGFSALLVPYKHVASSMMWQFMRYEYGNSVDHHAAQFMYRALPLLQADQFCLEELRHFVG